MTQAGVVLAAALVLAAPAPARTTGPTAAQVRRAVSRAERSSALWATVNICDTARYPDVFGVRGQMPALGFSADLRMTFEVDYFDQAHQAFARFPHLATAVDAGTASSGTSQDGVRLKFPPHTGLLRGRVVFSWRRDGRTIGSVTKLTSGGHSGVLYADPRGYSRDRCVIG